MNCHYLLLLLLSLPLLLQLYARTITRKKESNRLVNIQERLSVILLHVGLSKTK